MALTDKQIAHRENTMGASDVPVACGVSPYSGPIELFYKLTGKLPRYDREETIQQRIGGALEPVLAEITSEQLGLSVRRMPGRTHPKYKWLTAHADFEIMKHARGGGVLEIKNRVGEKPWITLPEDIQIQVAAQLAVTNREWGVVAGLFRFGHLETYEVERDKELEQYVIEICARFMVQVEKGEPPDATTWTARDLGVLKALYPKDNGLSIVLPPKALSYCAEFMLAKKQAAEEELYKQHMEGRIKFMMGEASAAECGPYAITWKQCKDSDVFDTKKFEQEHPDLYAKYLKPRAGARRFIMRKRGASDE